METKEQKKGHLLMVGGALSADTSTIYRRFIKLAGGKEKAKIGIIPTACSRPELYANRFAETLNEYGISWEQIVYIPLSAKIHNADSQWMVKTIEQCTGVWFLGGDQNYITETFLHQDKTQTEALKALWNLYEKGGIIGGTSAGAAIMSEIMISGGDSMSALKYGFDAEKKLENPKEYDILKIEKGLGFFTQGIIDQHFDRKARLGRLVTVCYENKEKFNFGFGIDENTALLYSAKNEDIEVLGEGGILIADLSFTQKIKQNGNFAYKNIKISYIEEGDIYKLETKEFDIHPTKKTTVGKEFFKSPHPASGGILSSNAYLKHFVGYNLVDNSALNKVKNYSIDDKCLGFELTFKQKPETEGFWAYFNGQEEHYSWINVELDILPVKIKIEYFTEEV